MKKTIYLIVLFALAVALAACGDRTAVKKVYQLEKMRADAARSEEKLLGIKPELASESGFKAVIDNYQNVFRYYKDNFPGLNEKDSLTEEEAYASFLAAQSLMRIGQLNLAMHDTAQAMADFEEFETMFRRNLMQQRYVWLTLAQIYTQQRNIEKVEDTYLKLIDLEDPPADSAGIPDLDVLPMPYKLAAFFKASDDKEKTEHYEQFAEKYYGKYTEKYPGTALWSASTRYLAETLRLAGRQKESIALLSSVTDSTGQVSKGAMMLIGETYSQDLGKPDSAIQYFQEVLDRGEDSTFTPRALMQMGNIQFLERRFDRARTTLQKVLDLDYATEFHPQAYRMIAISYEEQKQYEHALDNYQAIIEKFPNNSTAFDIYLYLPEFFTKYGQKQMRDQWYNRAETFFTNMRDDFPQKAMGAAAQDYLARFYIKYEDWNNAVEALNKLGRDFSRFTFAADAYLRIGTIYDSKLNEPDSAQLYYQKQIEAYPGTASSELAKKKIKNT